MSESESPKSRPLTILQGERELKLGVWLQLVRTFYLFQRRIVAMLTAAELTLPQFDVMATLRFSEGVTQQEMADRLLVTKGNVCGVIDRLETIGWVERRPDPEDRRANRLHLTASGKKKIETVLPEHDALVLRLTKILTVADTRTLQKLLLDLARAAEETPP